MSTQVQLHIRHDEMHDDMLRSEGVIGTGLGSVLGQLTAEEDYFDEFHELIQDQPSYVVGTDTDEFPRRIRDLIDRPKTVDDTLIKQVKAVVEDFGDKDGDICLWLENHRDEEVFTVSW